MKIPKIKIISANIFVIAMFISLGIVQAAAESKENLALHKSVEVSRETKGKDHNLITDGDTKSAGGSAKMWNVQAGEHVIIDLGETKSFNQLKLYEFNHQRLKGYTLETSQNGQDWTFIQESEELIVSKEESWKILSGIISFHSIKAKYIKLTIKEISDPETNKTTAYISEIEVYDSEDASSSNEIEEKQITDPKELANVQFTKLFDQPGLKVAINGEFKNFDQSAVIVNGRALVPLRGVFETLGAKVSWDNQKKEITVKNSGTSIRLKIGDQTANKDGKSVVLDEPPTLMNGNTMVPLRFVSEALGAVVNWDSTMKIVSILTNGQFLSSMFTDNMVLQQKVKIPVWGTAPSGQIVTVSFAGQQLSTVAEGNQWKVELQPVEAGGPYEMTVQSDNDSITLKNVLVGEVWVVSGQSNMAMETKDIVNAQQEIEKANIPEVRFFFQDRQGPNVPYLDVLNGRWVESNPITARYFSAVGYLFAREMHERLDVPIGIIYAAVSATTAEQWVDYNTLVNGDDLMDTVARWEQLQESSKYSRRPTSAYNGMIAPIQPYAIKGVLWYQGEGNAGLTKGIEYRRLFPALINQWREQWGQGEFPFLFVQLPKWNSSLKNNHGWQLVREAQVMTASSVENTGMAITIDSGEDENIHPKDKQTVVERLVLLARALVYGENIEYSGPIYKDMKIEGNQIKISFNHTANGLVARDGSLKGFTIAGEDKHFFEAKAEIIDDNTIAVWSDRIQKPIAVRYGWHSYPEVHLFNSEGLPASPFRTDDFNLQ